MVHETDVLEPDQQRHDEVSRGVGIDSAIVAIGRPSWSIRPCGSPASVSSGEAVKLAVIP
jgi:hypothetical protein